MDCLEILTSIEWDFFCAICAAGIKRRGAINLDLRSKLRANLEQSASQPCIYMLELADKNGLALTFREMIVFVKRAFTYINLMVIGSLRSRLRQV